MRAFVVEVPLSDVEVASDLLWSLGVVAVEEREGASGFVELWTSLGDDSDGSAVAQWSARAASTAPSSAWAWRLVEIDASVADTWREFARPVDVAPGLVVCPAWVDPGPRPGDEVLFVEPGSTFGLGDHPTTVLSLRALMGMVRPGDRVLDVGCGSGVLAIASMRFGAAAAVGIDIAPAAVPITLDNARRNGVDVAVSTTPLEAVDDAFDVVVANILAPTLVDLAPYLRRVTRRVLIISGVLDGRYDHVLEALAPMSPVDVEVLDGWAAIALRACA
ncbi:MAG: 50S ribosomal protein L11 methyltransferase [Ilumatobacteraceae bacterium]